MKKTLQSHISQEFQKISRMYETVAKSAIKIQILYLSSFSLHYKNKVTYSYTKASGYISVIALNLSIVSFVSILF